MSGLAFIASTFEALGVLTALAGLVFALLEAGRKDHDGPFERWLARCWRQLANSGWGALAGNLTRWLLAAIDGVLRDYFVEADRSIGFSVLFIGTVFVLIPAAALLNAAIGGSPFLILYFVSLVAVLAVLNFTGEVRALAVFNRAAALYLGVSLMLVVPAYVLQAFIERIKHENIAHAALGSILVAPFLYITAYSAMASLDVLGLGRKWGRTPAPAVGAIRGFLAALPVAFVLIFFAQLAGQLSVLAPAPGRSWAMLGSSLFFVSASLPLTVAIVGAGARSTSRLALPGALLGGLLAAAALSCALLYFSVLASPEEMTPGQVVNVLLGMTPDGARVHLGHDFWAMHLPFLPIKIFLDLVVLGWLAKAVALPWGAWAGAGDRDGDGRPRPFLLTALLFAVLSGVMWGAGYLTFT